MGDVPSPKPSFTPPRYREPSSCSIPLKSSWSSIKGYGTLGPSFTSCRLSVTFHSSTASMHSWFKSAPHEFFVILLNIWTIFQQTCQIFVWLSSGLPICVYTSPAYWAKTRGTSSKTGSVDGANFSWTYWKASRATLTSNQVSVMSRLQTRILFYDTHLKVKATITFWWSKYVVWRTMRQYFITVCSLLSAVDSIHVDINFHLKPWNKQPTKNKTWKRILVNAV